MGRGTEDEDKKVSLHSHHNTCFISCIYKWVQHGDGDYNDYIQCHLKNLKKLLELMEIYEKVSHNR